MKRIFVLLLITVFISGCGGITGFASYSFKKGFNEMIKIDNVYNTSFYTEALDVENKFSDGELYFFDWDRTITNIDNIDSMIDDLNKLRTKVESMKKIKDTEALLLVIDARIKMLESERLYQLGQAIGDKGDAYYGFACKDKLYVLNLSDYFNKSAIIGQESTSIFDKLLTHYPQTREFLSKENRPKFYDSPFWLITQYAINNKAIVEQSCP